MGDFFKFKFTHVIRLRDLNRQFDQRGGKKNPEAKSRRRKTKTNFKRIGQGRPKRIDPIKTIQRTQISQIVIDFILFFFRPFPAFQIVSPEMFSNIKAKSMRGGRGDVEERFPSVSARARTREENTHSLGKEKKSFLTAQNVEHGGAYLKTRGKGGEKGKKDISISSSSSSSLLDDY